MNERHYETMSVNNIRHWLYKTVVIGLMLTAPDTMVLAGDYKSADMAAQGKAKAVSTESKQTDPTPDYLHIPLETITGDTVHLADFRGHVLLLVNTASECGYTRQYSGLQELHARYGDSGLVVIGFPANNFGKQEPGTNEQIAQFCSQNFGVSFPMMAKVSVKGEDKHPLFSYLTEDSPVAGEISWNFTKFLIDRDGTPVARFSSSAEPLGEQVIEAIERFLKAPAG